MTVYWIDTLLWGFLSTVVLTVGMALPQGLGWSRISMPYLFGTMFTPRRDRAMWLGLVVHLALGTAFSFVYALAFWRLGHASWWLGLLAGFVHGLFVLTVGLPTLAAMHPRMASMHHGPTPTRQLEPPGFLGLNYGRWAPTITLLSHLLFGVVFALLYGASAGS